MPTLGVVGQRRRIEVSHGEDFPEGGSGYSDTARGEGGEGRGGEGEGREGVGEGGGENRGGEGRGRSTISSCVTAAESSHLV